MNTAVKGRHFENKLLERVRNLGWSGGRFAASKGPGGSDLVVIPHKNGAQNPGDPDLFVAWGPVVFISVRPKASGLEPQKVKEFIEWGRLHGNPKLLLALYEGPYRNPRWTVKELT
jgi:hypothetical protein